MELPVHINLNNIECHLSKFHQIWPTDRQTEIPSFIVRFLNTEQVNTTYCSMAAAGTLWFEKFKAVRVEIKKRHRTVQRMWDQ